MKTRSNSIQPLIDQGYNKYKEIKIAEMKSTSKKIKKDQSIKKIQKMLKQSTHQVKSKRISKSMINEEKKTPQKKITIKIKVQKMIPATTSTVKKMVSSNKMQHFEGENQVQVEGMNEVAKNLFAGKSKKIKKQSKINNKTQEYQNFYKFHFSKLKQEHPNWAGEKITQLLSLLWRKRKMDIKYASPKEVEQIYQKIMNGRQVFREFKIRRGTSQEEIDGLWDRLPVQSKRKWELESSGIVLQKMNNKKGKMHLNKHEQPIQQQNKFNFLKKVM